MPNISSQTHIDSVIRFLHFILMLSFLGAYVTGDHEGWHQWHMMFGYTLAISLGFRIMWQLIAPSMRVSHPFGLRKRINIGKNFLQKILKSINLKHLSKSDIQSVSSVVFHSSIALIFLVLPLTVTVGYFTENTHNHTLKEIHELLANLFLASVLLHLGSLLLNMLLLKKFWAKKMFWAVDYSIQALASMGLMLAAFLGFWYWYLG